MRVALDNSGRARGAVQIAHCCGLAFVSRSWAEACVWVKQRVRGGYRLHRLQHWQVESVGASMHPQGEFALSSHA
jgi:hypothetical protein